MSVRGPLSHIDMSVSDPDRSIPFYSALFAALGYRRLRSSDPEFGGERPLRAAWFIRYEGRSVFGVEVRPAKPDSAHKGHDRYAPGLHHIAFHAESRAAVDEVHALVSEAGGRVLDPPTDYSGRQGYTEGYYAVFFADPDGVKLEVVYEPLTNPRTG
jgi:catechol 2,3-dioxygenase-like lactoylglutathione lyase family enzyme